MSTKYFMVACAIGAIPDIAIAWIYMRLTDGGWSNFWWALVFLWAVQAGFAFKQFLANLLNYRLWAKRTVADAMAQKLKELKFPVPEETDFECVIHETAADPTRPIDHRMFASTWIGYFAAVESAGLIKIMRMRSACNAGLKQYAATGAL